MPAEGYDRLDHLRPARGSGRNQGIHASHQYQRMSKDSQDSGVTIGTSASSSALYPPSERTSGFSTSSSAFGGGAGATLTIPIGGGGSGSFLASPSPPSSLTPSPPPGKSPSKVRLVKDGAKRDVHMIRASRDTQDDNVSTESESTKELNCVSASSNSDSENLQR